MRSARLRLGSGSQHGSAVVTGQTEYRLGERSAW